MISDHATNDPYSGSTAYLNNATSGRQGIGWFLASMITSLSAWQIIGAIPYALLILIGDPKDQLAAFIALNVSFIFLIVGLVFSLRIYHRLPFTSLISPEHKIRFSLFWQAFFTWLVLSALTSLIDGLLRPGVYVLTLSWEAWLPFLAASVFLTPIQTAAEELLFRGYLLQQISRLTTKRWLLALISGMLFMLPHFFNPEMQSDFLLTALFYFSFGVFVALITLRAGRLEYAIGIHAANNLTTILLANYRGSALPSPAIFTATSLDSLYNLISFLAGGLICWMILFSIFPSPTQRKGDPIS
jgi:membrane protease YdiL (CAAX protease family)